ncbi:MAG: hypothetical protein HQK52_07585 [Oligoflexia bacterium]|nr:hypothetical protein [Oligoflexia bacterium]
MIKITFFLSALLLLISPYNLASASHPVCAMPYAGPSNIILYSLDGAHNPIDSQFQIVASMTRVDALESSMSRSVQSLTATDQSLSAADSDLANRLSSLSSEIVSIKNTTIPALKTDLTNIIKDMPETLLNDEEISKVMQAYVEKLFEKKRQELEKQILKKYNLVQ